MIITWQTIITFAAVLTAIITIFKQYNKGYDLVKHQEEQDKAIADIVKHQADETVRLDVLREELKMQINDELKLITTGVLACLKGLQEQGCDGDVTAAIGNFEKHLNDKAHS